MTPIQRGKLLLDAKCPNWRDRVDPNTLDMANTDKCLVTQVFGNYRKGLVELGLAFKWIVSDDGDGPIQWDGYQVADHGFTTVASKDISKDMKELTLQWKEELNKQGPAKPALVAASLA